MLDIARDGAALVLTMNEPARRNALSMGMRQRFIEALEWERTGQAALFLTADHAEGKAAFLAKRRPVFKGV